MAEAKNNKIWIVAFWVIFALTVTGGVAYFAWNRTDEPTNTVTDSNAPKCDKKSKQLTETDKLGPNDVEITACNFEAEVIQAKGLVVVDAYASWCPHCQKLAPIMTQIADEYVGRVKVGKLNANNQDEAMKENFDFAVEKGLEGYPTVWFYKDGKVVDSFSGARTYEEVKALVEKNI
jgi:thioredoxin 1